MGHDNALLRFGRRCTEGEETSKGREVDVPNPENTPEPWTLPGKLAVFFKSDDQRYIQSGTKLLRQ